MPPVEMSMSTPNAIGRARPITGHIANDVLRLYREGRPDYRRVADLIQLSKEDLSKLAKVARSSVRFDDANPRRGGGKTAGNCKHRQP